MDETISDLNKFLKNSEQCTKLNLYRQRLCDNNAKKLAEKLKVNNSLVELNLKFTQIEDPGAIEIAKALKVSNSMTSLDLRFNKIGVLGAIELAEALKVNKSLAYLELRFNKIGVTGTIKIAKALKVNKSLTSLGLEYNKIQAEGIKAMAEMFKFNNSLMNLNLQCNNCDDEGGITELAKASLFDVITNIDSIKHENTEHKTWEEIENLLSECEGSFTQITLTAGKILYKRINPPKRFFKPLDEDKEINEPPLKKAKTSKTISEILETNDSSLNIKDALSFQQ